ncbi:hypothetical protein WJX73_003003 [Symbiochloris irregularis]|uniref:Uncharacterized protein n=1 Tax=Symbiochloris irregularis TaxID=706552 RepID=A0AAW1PLX2_9CHLO
MTLIAGLTGFLLLLAFSIAVTDGQGTPTGGPATAPLGTPSSSIPALVASPPVMKSPPPPAPNAPGNTINPASLTAADTTFQATLRLTGSDITNPLSTQQQQIVVLTTANIQQLSSNGLPASVVLANLQAGTFYSPPANGSSTQCQRHFHHWCLDGTSLDSADVAGIIVGGVIFVVLVAALIGWAVLRQRNNSRPDRGNFVAQTEVYEQTPEERNLFATQRDKGPSAGASTNIGARTA